MKRVCKERMLPVVDYVVAARGQSNVDEICERLPFPMFVKPANLGSSVGISKAHDRAELETALAFAEQYDRKIIVERGIRAASWSARCWATRRRWLPCPAKFCPSREFYDYEDKYLLDRAQTKLPADLPAERTDELRRLAVECYRAVECEGMARVDFLLESATGQAVHQRDQYHPRIHVDQHVPEDVGAQRHRLRGADRPVDRAGARPPQAEEGHPVHAIEWVGRHGQPSQTDDGHLRRVAGNARSRKAGKKSSTAKSSSCPPLKLLHMRDRSTSSSERSCASSTKLDMTSSVGSFGLVIRKQPLTCRESGRRRFRAHHRWWRRTAIITRAPQLAIEVLSPSETRRR